MFPQQVQEQTVEQIQEAYMRWRPRDWLRFALLVAVVVFAVGLLLTWGVILFRYSRSTSGLPPAVYRYTSTVERLSNEPVCPGRTFTYPVKIDISKAPSAISIIETVWSDDLKRTVVSDMLPENYAYIDPVVIKRTFTFTVPQLPPGHYAVHHVAYESGTQPTGFSVKFEVAEGCP